MKKGYLIYTKYEAKRNKDFINILMESSKKRNIDLILLFAENIKYEYINNSYIVKAEGCDIVPTDFIIQRKMDYRLSQAFESMGCRVFNSSHISKNFDNKFYAYKAISNIAIPILKTLLINKNEKEKLFFPCVIKPTSSKGGDRVYYCYNINSYNENLSKLNEEDFIIQEPSLTIGKDLRVYVIGKQIITSILRTSKSGFLSNYCLGGEASIYSLSSREKEIVKKIIDSFDFDYVGIDFLFNNSELVFNEVENVVGARMVYNLTNINIGEKFIEYIASTI